MHIVYKRNQRRIFALKVETTEINIYILNKCNFCVEFLFNAS
jgi:hypothetical protein